MYYVVSFSRRCIGFT